MRIVLVGLAALWASGVSSSIGAGMDAEWVWFDEADPAQSAPAGKIWLRREVPVDQPSTCQVRIACDDAFTLWVNGRKIGSGGGDESFRFNLNGIVEEGVNVFAIEAENKGGPAGVVLDGVVRSQGGDEIAIDSGPEWRVTRTEPKGTAWLEPRFAAEGWSAPKLLGKHDQTRWKDIVFSDSYLDRYWLADGFTIERIAEPELAGSIIAFTFGNRGTILASPEREPIKVLTDQDKDGKFDKATTFSEEVRNCQGLLVVGTDVYAIGDGPKGAGLYRLKDDNQDDVADSVEHLHEYRGGMGEHGPHAAVLGPDGWLYHCIGNHAGSKAKPQPTTPCRGYIEGYLLEPKFEDGRGHAAGIKAPGGTIWQLDRDAKEWWMVTNGFRNEYDISLNADGEIFTFDSDMEWDIGEPWYRPVRVNHCTWGAEFGWRSGAAKWPEHYLDSLPAIIDIGRGSPTGVCFYEHTQFPERYRGAFLICDWSMGRIIAVRLQPNGASYHATAETIVTGNPLNASDIEVAPDGSVIVSTGGRGTEGGLYRIRHGSETIAPATADTIEELLDLPQMSSAWAREIARGVQAKVGAPWESTLIEVARNGSAAHKIRALTLLSQFGPKPSLDLLVAASGDKDARVRAFAAWLLAYHTAPESASALTTLLSDPDLRVRRRACESFVRSGQEPPVDPLIAMLASEDRFLRYSARLALERVPVEKWLVKIVQSPDNQTRVYGGLALLRVDSPSFRPSDVLTILLEPLRDNPELRLDVLRLASLAILRGADGPPKEVLASMLLPTFPSGDATTDMETARLLARLQVAEANETLLDALEQSPTQQLQVHFALCLRYLEAGWTTEGKRRYLRWYDRSSSFDGGHSFVPYLENIVSATFPRLTPKERHDLIADWQSHPYATRLLLRRSGVDEIENAPALLEQVIAETQARSSTPYASEVYDLCLDALGKSRDPASQVLLRRLFEENPDQRDTIASKLAEHPTPESREPLLRSLSFASPTTLQFCLRGLDRLDTKPQKPEDIRQVILAGLKLQDAGGKIAVELLAEWTQQKPPSDEVSVALAFYQKWFHETYPNEPTAELPVVDKEKDKYTFEQLMDFLERDPRGRQGDVARGKSAYAKAQCNKCHKLGDDGQGIGPDLTTLRRRFQRKEIIEAIVHPSAVISDQYRTVTIATVDGLVQTGMLAAQEGQDKVVLWLNNGERMELDKDEIEEQKPATISLMPPGLLKDLSLEEIADLFAYLETSKSNPEPAASAKAGGGNGK